MDLIKEIGDDLNSKAGEVLNSGGSGKVSGYSRMPMYAGVA